MRIAHVITGLGIGGAEYMLKDIVAEYERRGYEQQIFYFRDGPLVEQMSVSCVRVTSFSFFKVLKSFLPDIICSSLWRANMLSIVAGKRMGVPVMITLHNNASHDGWVRQIFNRIMLPWADYRVAVADTVADSYRRLLSAKHSSSIAIIPNGINIQTTDYYKKNMSVKRSDLNIRFDTFVIGVVGRLEPVKGFDRLIRLCGPLCKTMPLCLVIVGDGSQRDALQSLAQQLGIDQAVRFVGAADAMRYYSLFDCFVQTSHSEGLSRALLEAMSFELPCVILEDTMYHPVIVHNQNGLLACNLHEMTMQIIELYENKKSRVDLAKAARLSIEKKFSLVRMIDLYIRFIDC